MSDTKIDWATKVWNPVTGCTPVSEGCRNCYAARMSKRLAGRCGYPADDPFQVTLHPDRLSEPLQWKKPQRIFVCSMGDMFHPDVPLCYQGEMLHVMETCRHHTFLLLTKRPQAYMFVGSDNIWLGVSIEDQKTADERVPLLLQAPAAKRFVSIEPLLGPVTLNPWLLSEHGRRHIGAQPGLSWVIAGGETGPQARPMHPDWVRSLRDQCQAAAVPFFFKQWGEWLGGKFDRRKGKMICQCTCPTETTGRIFWTNPGAPKVHLWNEVDHYWTHASARVGKKAAGHHLDGHEHRQFPESTLSTPSTGVHP